MNLQIPDPSFDQFALMPNNYSKLSNTHKKIPLKGHKRREKEQLNLTDNLNPALRKIEI